MQWLRYFDKVALVRERSQIHYGQLMHAICSVGEQLRSGHASGSRIALIGGNSPEWALALYSCWHAGLIPVPIDSMSTAEEIAYIFRDCTPSAVFTDASSAAKVSQACTMSGVSVSEISRLEALQEVMSSSPCLFCQPEESPDDDIALLIYTSGTTGNPKGVMLTFGNLRANTEACSVQTKVFIPEDKVLVALPLHHAYPLMASLIMPMSIGATAVFATSLTGNAIMSALRENQCTFIIGVPRLLEIFRNSLLNKVQASRPGRLLLSVSATCGSLWLSRLIFGKVQKAFGGHIRYISSGGAAADPQLVRDFYALGFHLLEGYGMTETAPMISFTPPDRHKAGSPGKPIPCNEISIRDGEVLVRGKNVMKGYYNRPEETAQVLDADGWLHTGDLGYLDRDGFLFLTGRSKELIILGNGKNINPAELEQKLLEYADGMFSECAVTDDGRHLVAILVPDLPVLADRGILNIRQTLMDKVIEPYNEAVPSYKRLARLELSEQPLPRTRLGKPRRHVIRQLLKNGFETRAADDKAAKIEFISPLEEQICQCLEKIAGRPVRPNEHFELELNLDSLGKIAFISSLGRELGRELDISLLAQYPTARQLAEALPQQQPAEQNNPPAVPAPGGLRQPSWTHGFWRLFITAAMRCLASLTAEGSQNLPDGPCIFAPNHASLLDAFFLIGTLDGQRFRNTYFYAISKFFEGKLRHWFASRHNLIAMEINGDLRQSMSQLALALREGKSVVIFPEGTRSMDGALGEFRPSFAQLAAETGVPVIPVAIRGTYEVLPRWAHYPKFGRRVNISFLPALRPGEVRDDEALCRATRDRIAIALQASR